MTCSPRLTARLPASYLIDHPDTVGSGLSALISGLTINGVRAVSVIVNGRARPATMVRDGYYLSLGDPQVARSSRRSRSRHHQPA
jgi:hypothetical protein